MQVDLDEVAAVHVGVGLDGADERGHALVDSHSSPERRSAVSVAATQRSAAPVVGPASAATRSSHSWSRPAAASGSAIFQGSSTPRSFRRPSSSSSASEASSACERGRARGALGGLLLQLHELRGVLALDAALDEGPQRGADRVERFGELRRGAPRGGGGVAQLVREPRGHRAERGEALAVGLDCGDATGERGDLPHHAPVDRGLREREAAEVLGADERESAGRACLHAHRCGVAGERRDGAHPGRCVLRADLFAAALADDQRLRLALEQQLQAAGLLALLGDHLARRDVARVRDGGPLRELLVGELVEEVDRAQLVEGDRRRGRVAHASTRYSWISETAIEPSPTAEATRLIERARTSPATKTPGIVVSRM